MSAKYGKCVTHFACDCITEKLLKFNKLEKERDELKRQNKDFQKIVIVQGDALAMCMKTLRATMKYTDFKELNDEIKDTLRGGKWQ